MLASQNLIITTRGAFGGSFVAEPSAARFASSLSGVVKMLWAMTTPSAESCLEMRELLEIPGAGLAAQRRTEPQLALMSLAIPNIAADLPDQLSAYQDFHGLLAGAVQNPLYELLARPLHKLCVDTQLAHGGDWEAWANDCQLILDRVAAHDVAGAQEAVTRHLLRLRIIAAVPDPVVG